LIRGSSLSQLKGHRIVRNSLWLYALPYDPRYPLVCYDERPCFLIGDRVEPLALQSGQIRKEHYTYEKLGSAALLAVLEPLTGRRLAQRFEFHFTPGSANWLTMIEIEFSVLARLCLDWPGMNLITPMPLSAYNLVSSRLDPIFSSVNPDPNSTYRRGAADESGLPNRPPPAPPPPGYPG
jgi:hypothetical protein